MRRSKQELNELGVCVAAGVFCFLLMMTIQPFKTIGAVGLIVIIFLAASLVFDMATRVAIKDIRDKWDDNDG